MNTESENQWVLGLDLRADADGAITFAKWLRDHLEPQIQLTGLHVIEEDVHGILTQIDPHAEVLTLAESAVATALARAGAEQTLDSLRLVESEPPEEALAQAAADAEGLIIGRLAPRGKVRLVRLGRVARRLLRQLPAPTIVVPPDLQPTDVGAGPIIVATNAHDDALEAIHFAARMAARLERELVLALVVSTPHGWPDTYLPRAAIEQIHSGILAGGERKLAHWAQTHDLTQHRQVVRAGAVAHQLLDLAEHEDALMLVTGSRQLGALGRVFSTSVGTLLCGSARCPVAVVAGP